MTKLGHKMRGKNAKKGLKKIKKGKEKRRVQKSNNDSNDCKSTGGKSVLGTCGTTVGGGWGPLSSHRGPSLLGGN